MDFSKILEDKETENIEFKSSLSLKKEIGIAISAFSNSSGGKIFVGINDDPKIIGVDIGSRTLENLANFIISNTDPRFSASIKVEKVNNKNVIIIDVSESNEKPQFFKGRAFIRMGITNQVLSVAQIKELIEQGRHAISWDEKIHENASFDDIDDAKVRWFLQNMELERNRNIDPNTPIQEALNKLDLLENDSLTNAALLLFSKNPQKFFLQAETKCAKFKDNTTLDFEDMKTFEGNIFDQRQDALNFVMKHIRHSATIKGIEREDTFEYPPEAIREAITNAICHRDYRLSSNVQVRIFDDRLEVWGSGGLPGKLTLDDLKVEHKSVPRNKLIAKCFYDVKFIEHWGTGTVRMIQSCIEQNLPEPLFEIKSGDLVVTFRKYKFLINVKDLKESQYKAISYLMEHERITNKEYRELNSGMIRQKATEELKDLVKKEVLLSRGRLQSTYYILNK